MAEIGNIVTRAGSFQETVASISVDESISGILFDISGFSEPFKNRLQLENYFGNQQVRLVNNMDDLEAMGLKDEGYNGFLYGLAYYHLSMFYDYMGADKPLYIAFADCSKDWSFIIDMQRATNGRIFQLGIWTHQNLWEIDESTGLVTFTKMVIDIETTVEELSGRVGQPSGSPIPLSVILSADTKVGIRNFTLRKLPNGTAYNAPKVSVVLCQNGSDFVHTIQPLMPNNAVVGCIGFTMAILSLAGAEENIGAVMDYNLNKNDNFQFPEIPVDGTYIPLEDVNKVVQNILASYGYIVPTTYAAKEGECYLGCDATLSSGDYSIISNNRIMHKCRRAIFSVLLPYLHSNQLYETAAKGLSRAALQIFEEAIGSALTGKLVNRGGQYQIDGYQITTFDTENILNDDTVSISYTVKPVNYNGALTETVIAL